MNRDKLIKKEIKRLKGIYNDISQNKLYINNEGRLCINLIQYCQ